MLNYKSVFRNNKYPQFIDHFMSNTSTFTSSGVFCLNGYGCCTLETKIAGLGLVDLLPAPQLPSSSQVRQHRVESQFLSSLLYSLQSSQPVSFPQLCLCWCFDVFYVTPTLIRPNVAADTIIYPTTHEAEVYLYWRQIKSKTYFFVIALWDDASFQFDKWNNQNSNGFHKNRRTAQENLQHWMMKERMLSFLLNSH